MAHSEKPAPGNRRKPGASTRTPAGPSSSAIPPQPSQNLNASATPDDPAAEARRKKIAGIKKALSEGTYQVSNEEVARKVIEHMLQPKK